MCFLPTASGGAEGYISKFYDFFNQQKCSLTHLSLFRPHTRDLKSFIMENDIVYVGSGNTKAYWDFGESGGDKILKKAWEEGKVPRNILGKVFSISSSLNYTSDTLSLGAISGILAIFSTAIVFSGGGVAILLTGIIGAITLKTKSNNQMQGNTDNKFIC
ncbi:Type 1 glutamine amidotransferase-like domain-containing protein [Pseudogracilibacillus auburnensis]|uniref:Type 1 glutamine amidotransferase-like domain-containing protein n=1 Tax=Pseudogracilibacillus auburnensis TaxID=1494959 RepID=UPI0035560A65